MQADKLHGEKQSMPVKLAMSVVSKHIIVF